MERRQLGGEQAQGTSEFPWPCTLVPQTNDKTLPGCIVWKRREVSGPEEEPSACRMLIWMLCGLVAK